MKILLVFLSTMLMISSIGCGSNNSDDGISTPTFAQIPITSIPTRTTSTKSPSTPTQSSPLSPTPNTVSLPDWVNDPDTQILLVPTGSFKDGYKNMALINAATSEQYEINAFPESRDYFWLPDGTKFGFLPRDENRVTLISTINGETSSTLVSENAVRFVLDRGLFGLPYPLQATSSHPEDPQFFLLHPSLPLSPDRKYFVYQETYDEAYTSIFEVSSNQIVSITDPKDEYFDLFSAWSPDSRFLAVSHVDQEPGPYYHFENLPTFRLRVYVVATHEMIASYKNVTHPNWSPDGTKFLFQEWKTWFGESPPCIFDTITGSTKCFNELLSRHKNANTIQTTFSSITWSPDQTVIGYIYSTVESDPHREYGGFCTILVSTNNIKCMLEKFELERQKIISYSWSPDNSYIAFEYDTACPYCDYSDAPQLAIANVQTGEYFTLGDNVNIFQLGLWRPMVKP